MLGSPVGQRGGSSPAGFCRTNPPRGQTLRKSTLAGGRKSNPNSLLDITDPRSLLG